MVTCCDNCPHLDGIKCTHPDTTIRFVARTNIIPLKCPLRGSDKIALYYFKYDVIGGYKSGIKISPLEEMQRLGFKVNQYKSDSYSDLVLFEVTAFPAIFPKYVIQVEQP